MISEVLREKVLLWWFFLLCWLITLSLSAVETQTGAISGIVTLPPGMAAGPDGVHIRLDAIIKDYDGPETAVEIKIAKGENSTKFTLSVSPSVSKKYRLRFFSRSAGFLRSGYWSRTGTVPFRAERADMWIDISRSEAKSIKLVIPPDDQVIDYEAWKVLATKEAQNEASAIIKPHFSDFEKVIAIHDYLLAHLTYYKDEIAQRQHLQVINDTFHATALKSGVAVCNGYAESFADMALSAGLETRIIDVPGSHAWVEVRLLDRFWHIDLSYNDHTSQFAVFLLSDAQMEIESPSPNYWPHSHASDRLNSSFPYSPQMATHLSEINSYGFHRLFGKIRLPAGEVAPPGGITLWAYLNGEKLQRYFIPPGEDAAFFALLARSTPKKQGLRIEVENKDSRYARRYWYSGPSGFVNSSNLSQPLDVTAPDHTGIDLTLLPISY